MILRLERDWTQQETAERVIAGPFVRRDRI